MAGTGAENQAARAEEIERIETHDSEIQAEAAEAKAEILVAETPKRAWQSYIWDSFDKSPEERKLVLKLDLALLTFGSLGYFIKYLDQTNINNAFVSGMKEDLSLYGNQLNYMQTTWAIGYCIGEVPANIILTRVRASIFIPCVEIVWSVLTMCLSRCNSAEQLYVVRFFVGLAEAALYPGMTYIIGSWYRSDELAKRICIFQMSSAVATMFSGYLMAAVYHLGGVGGLKGWQWLFIIDGVISLPIALAGFYALPDVPEITRAHYLTKTEIALAQRRMEVEGRATRQPYTRKRLIKIFTSWRWWTLVPLYVFWNNGGSSGQPVFAQWLKDSTNPIYSITQINVYPTTTSGAQILATIIFAWSSDSIFKGRRWPLIIIGGAFNIVCYISLSIWYIPDGWRWACYVLTGVGAGLAGICMSWAHEICSDDNEERAIVIGSMNEMAYVMQIWLPLVVWQQVSAPMYRAGFITVLFLSVGMLVMTGLVYWFRRREIAKKVREAEAGYAVPPPEVLNVHVAEDEKTVRA